ncbi:hypothetical protein HJD18_12325 [Thermoleophilia bacterium SCSIO 60948]|nr:hypothetical protein HJD18_12325 [Thermoleophilia bacterium SCSIO 60948]
MRRRRIGAACTALVAALGITALGATGAVAKPRADTKVTAGFENTRLEGEVKSVRACEGGRKIALIKDSELTGREIVARTRTKRSGAYAFDPMLFEINAEYTMRAEPRARRNVFCKAGKVPVRLN